MRKDVLRFLGFVEQLAPLRSGYLRRFTDLSPLEQDRVLGALESSSIGPLRAGFEALKGLVMLGYYRDARTFGVIGYRGPLVTPVEGHLIRRGRELSGEVTETADAVVVGTGAGGGMAVRELARAGL